MKPMTFLEIPRRKKCMISLVTLLLRRALIREPVQVPVDSADSRVVAMAAIRNFTLMVKTWMISLVISLEICSTAVTAQAMALAETALMSTSPVTVADSTAALAEADFTVAAALADSISRISLRKAPM